MSHFIATLPDGNMYFVFVIEFYDKTILVETLDGKRAEIERKNLILT